MVFNVSDPIITVDEMTAILHDTISSTKKLQNISVRGELLGFKRHTSGHSYFTILGAETRVSCVLFRSNAASIITWPVDGDEVLVRGRVDIYGARGSYQIYATNLFPIGAGAKARAKEILKNKLANEGVFDLSKKRPIPLFPEKIAIITSPTGAALQDVLKISSLRFPATNLIIVPSLMQGIDARKEILIAFNKCKSIVGLSLIMLVRGGGNRDDLDIFDDESVVRAIHVSSVPVITGLGHQIDITLSDLAADFSSPTPSGVAERVFPDIRELLQYLQNVGKRMPVRILLLVERLNDNIKFRQESLMFNLFKGIIEPASDFIENSYDKLKNSITYRLENFEIRLDSMISELNSSSPLNILSKGYSVCKDKNGKTVNSVSLLSVGSKILLELRNGSIEATVDKIIIKNK